MASQGAMTAAAIRSQVDGLLGNHLRPTTSALLLSAYLGHIMLEGTTQAQLNAPLGQYSPIQLSMAVLVAVVNCKHRCHTATPTDAVSSPSPITYGPHRSLAVSQNLQGLSTLVVDDYDHHHLPPPMAPSVCRTCTSNTHLINNPIRRM